MTTTTETPVAVRRSAGLVGNSLVLIGVVLFTCEFVGIIGSGVHTMPLLPGASAHQLSTTYAGQTGATGFLVGWYSLVLPFRVLIVLGVRQALLASSPERFGPTWRALLSWAVALMALGVAAELTSAAVLAGAASIPDPAGLNVVAHYLQVVVLAPSGMASVLMGVGMWRSGVFPRILAVLVGVPAAIQAVNGTFLSAPHTADLQDSLTVLNLLGFPVVIWLGVLVFLRRPRASRD